MEQMQNHQENQSRKNLISDSIITCSICSFPITSCDMIYLLSDGSHCHDYCFELLECEEVHQQ